MCGYPRSLNSQRQSWLLGRSPAGWMALPPSAALCPGFSVLGNGSSLAQASPGSILKALHLTAVPWGLCWWINLAGGASFMHLSLGPHASSLCELEGRREGKITSALLNLTFCWTRWVTLESVSWTRPSLGPSALPVNTGL